MVSSLDLLQCVDGRQLRANGQEARLVARNIEGHIDSVAFSPDGGKLVWVESRKNNDQFIYIANIDGSGIHEIFSNANLPPEYNITSNILWSPDGTRLVYVGYHGGEFIYPFWVLTLGDGESVTPTQ
jgi:Tol biopolymer transport system component